MKNRCGWVPACGMSTSRRARSGRRSGVPGRPHAGAGLEGRGRAVCRLFRGQQPGAAALSWTKARRRTAGPKTSGGTLRAGPTLVVRAAVIHVRCTLTGGTPYLLHRSGSLRRSPGAHGRLKRDEARPRAATRRDLDPKLEGSARGVLGAYSASRTRPEMLRPPKARTWRAPHPGGRVSPGKGSRGCIGGRGRDLLPAWRPQPTSSTGSACTPGEGERADVRGRYASLIAATHNSSMPRSSWVCGPNCSIHPTTVATMGLVQAPPGLARRGGPAPGDAPISTRIESPAWST